MKDPFCDEDGVCSPADLTQGHQSQTLRDDVKIIYVGDPMCSWCWGISNHLEATSAHYRRQGIGFEIIVGGLRPGGGDPWDDQMKDFLKHHWKEVNERSGQPFAYDLFDRAQFEYDTEPSCRAVVVAKSLLDQQGVLKFFEAVQRKFYVDNQDPKEASFYEDICQPFNISFSDFARLFDSAETMEATRAEFMLNRQWGVKGYPTVVLQVKEQLFLVCNGYATSDVMKERIDGLLTENARKQTIVS